MKIKFILLGVLSIVISFYFYQEQQRKKDDAIVRLHLEGKALFAQDKYRSAIEKWLEETKLEENSPDTWNNIGMAYTVLGKLDQAIAYHGKAIKINPKFGHGYYSLGRAYHHLQDYDKARSSYERAIKEGWGKADSYFSLGQIMMILGDCESAVIHYKKTIQLNSNYPSAQDQLDLCQKALGKYNSANKLAEQSPQKETILTKIAEQDSPIQPTLFEFNLNNSIYTVSFDGAGIRRDDKGKETAFNLPLYEDFYVDSIEFALIDSDLIIIYQETDHDGAAGRVVRLDALTLKQTWVAFIPSFNIGTALIHDKSAYLTSIGFIGKLNLITGQYDWQHNKLYRKPPGLFNSFETPILKKGIVYFTERPGPDKKKSPVTIEVNRFTGEIIKPYFWSDTLIDQKIAKKFPQKNEASKEAAKEIADFKTNFEEMVKKSQEERRKEYEKVRGVQPGPLTKEEQNFLDMMLGNVLNIGEPFTSPEEEVAFLKILLKGTHKTILSSNNMSEDEEDNRKMFDEALASSIRPNGKNKEYLDLLLKVLKYEENYPKAIATAASSLCSFQGDERLKPILHNLVNHSYSSVKLKAAKCLHYLGEIDKGISILNGLVNHSDPSIKFEAAESLLHIGDSDKAMSALEDLVMKEGASSALSALYDLDISTKNKSFKMIDERGYDILKKALNHTEPRVRIEAVRLLLYHEKSSKIQEDKAKKVIRGILGELKSQNKKNYPAEEEYRSYSRTCSDALTVSERLNDIDAIPLLEYIVKNNNDSIFVCKGGRAKEVLGRTKISNCIEPEFRRVERNITPSKMETDWEKMPSVKAGDRVNLRIKISNWAEHLIATRAFIDIYDPDMAYLRSTMDFEINLPPGKEQYLEFSYQTCKTAPRGVWHTTYSLLGKKTMEQFGEVEVQLRADTEADDGKFIVN